ncbi:hypothetical protein [Rhizobium sp.]|uniref:hypothetical protein n=1 Tax=Rhizobium sp. TaxID=391 RepID=UPI0034C6A043
MTKTILAFFTDTHLGQKLVTKTEIAGDKMGYEETPQEHEHHLRLILDDIARKGISRVVFGGDIGTAHSVAAFSNSCALMPSMCRSSSAITILTAMSRRTTTWAAVPWQGNCATRSKIRI